MTSLSVVAVALMICFVTSATATAVESKTWTLSGAAFLGGTLENVTLSSDGTLQLIPRTPPSYREVVLDVGSPGTADSVYARYPFVLHDTDGTYKMWYSGYDGYRNRILYATSADGIVWTKQGVLFDVLTPPYYWDSVACESVLKIGATYHMWFSAGFWNGGTFGYWAQIYHAVSADAVSWNVTGVVLPPNQTWDVGMTNAPWVVQDSLGTFWLFFSGWDGTTTRIGVATSTNGTWFTPYPGNPILNLGSVGAWDDTDVNLPSVSHVITPGGPSWTMFYTGWDGSMGRIGAAHSPDGLNWTKDSSNPAFVPEAAPAWDDGGISSFQILQDVHYAYFAGSTGGTIRIGLYRMTPHPIPVVLGSYTSPAFDSGRNGTVWESLSTDAQVPASTRLSFGVRTGNTSIPDETWSGWSLMDSPTSATHLSLPTSRFVEIQVAFVSDNFSATPSLRSISVTYTPWSVPALAFASYAVAGLGAAGGAAVGGALAFTAVRLGRKGPRP